MEGAFKNKILFILFIIISIYLYNPYVQLYEGDCSLFFSLSLLEEKKKRAKPLKTYVDVTLFQKQVIAGLLFSDGHLRNSNKAKRKTGNFRLEFTFKIAVLNYCQWIKFVLLYGLCTESETTPYPKENPTQVWFSTRQHVYFTEIYGLWYMEKERGMIKVIPSNDYLELFYNEVSLAHTIMGDGYWENSSKTVIICTESFPHDDVSRFIKFIEYKFGLKASRLKRVNNYRIRFSGKKENIQKLRSLVLPYMHESMLYKLGLKLTIYDSISDNNDSE
nr:hypothetical protein [Oedogonium sp. 244]